MTDPKNTAWKVAEASFVLVRDALDQASDMAFSRQLFNPYQLSDALQGQVRDALFRATEAPETA